MITTLALLVAVGGGDAAYWDAWHKEAGVVAQCNDDSRTEAFLRAALSNLGNTERSEANSEALENIMVANPACFLRGLKRMTPAECIKAVESFVAHPVFLREEEVHGALGIKLPTVSDTLCRPTAAFKRQQNWG